MAGDFFKKTKLKNSGFNKIEGRILVIFSEINHYFGNRVDRSS